MFPDLALNNTAYGGIRKTKPASYLTVVGTICTLLPNGKHFGICQLGIWMLLAAFAIHPVASPFRHQALSHRIPSVLSRCAEKQVTGIDAGLNIAMVANKHARWDWTKGNFPHDSMHILIDLIVAGYSVAVFHNSAYPEPALIRCAGFYPRPKTRIKSGIKTGNVGGANGTANGRMSLHGEILQYTIFGAIRLCYDSLT